MKISFEFYPPKTDEGLNKLVAVAQKLKKQNPEYFSVTYGAGGSTQEKTVGTVKRIAAETACMTAAHITCIGAKKQTISALLELYKARGIKRLVVLRGDRPSGVPMISDDFQHAVDLVKFIRKTTGNHFHIEVAAYPEMHPETLDPKRHILHFKEKVDAGANGAITQYFYNSDAYAYLLDDCHKHGIDIPIVPGIMPITNYDQLARFSRACGAEIPRWLKLRLESFNNDLESIKAFGAEFVAGMCERLITLGAPALHFYTLNLSKPSLAILEKIGLLQNQL